MGLAKKDYEKTAIDDLNVRASFFLLNHFLIACPFHNQNPDSTINGNNAHWIARTAFGKSLTGP